MNCSQDPIHENKQAAIKQPDAAKKKWLGVAGNVIVTKSKKC
jgi:hypothetical protein